MERIVGMLALYCLAAIAVLSGPPRFTNASRPVRGIDNPVLAMEVVRDPSEVDAILSDAPSADREAMRLKQYADFGFIAGYACLFAAMAMLLGRAAYAAGAIGVIAAGFDVAENIFILRVVDTPLATLTQAQIDAIRHASLAKWGLAALALGYFGVFMTRRPSIGLRIAGLFNLAACGLGLYGLYQNVFLAWTGLVMLAGFLTLAIGFFPRYRGRRRRA
jgi:hypothetical protein